MHITFGRSCCHMSDNTYDLHVYIFPFSFQNPFPTCTSGHHCQITSSICCQKVTFVTILVIYPRKPKPHTFMQGWAQNIAVSQSQCVCMSVCPLTYLNKRSAVAETGDHLVTISICQNLGAVSLFRREGAGFPSNTMWPGPRPISVPSGTMIHQPVGHNRHGPKIGEGCPAYLGRGAGSHLAQCGLGRGLPSY